MNLSFTDTSIDTNSKLAEIDSLHEVRLNNYEKIQYVAPRLICGECFMPWPCATHRIIHNEGDTDCVHGI